MEEIWLIVLLQQMTGSGKLKSAILSMNSFLNLRITFIVLIVRFCSACRFDMQINLTMRGLCPSETKLMEGFFDTEYFIEGFLNEKVHWRGSGKSHIYYIQSDKTWRLESLYDVNRYAELTSDDSIPTAFYPIGRKEWKISSGICLKENQEEHMMTLTNCKGGKEFTCDDGSCVSIDQRCNLITDCSDASDEKNCDILKIEDDYRKEMFPRTSTGDPLPISVKMSVLALPKVNALDLSFTADFVLTMSWIDPRLNFYDLQEASDLNSLSDTLKSRIWSPSLSFTNIFLCKVFYEPHTPEN